ncbi:hypothetical protein, partial [Eubacterium sp. BIOML-A1]|uniref:hypothetical protein n=1 Tax=Eubacterium sp. BIOML-A1 TaxID=2584643 RepID=UPI0019D50962
VFTEPSAGNHQISRNVFSVPAYPASAVLESLSSMGAYRNGIYSPSGLPGLPVMKRPHPSTRLKLAD